MIGWLGFITLRYRVAMAIVITTSTQKREPPFFVGLCFFLGIVFLVYVLQ